MTIKLHFFGAAGCVTGSCMLLEVDQAQVLIDCGMFQGSKTLKELNYRPFPFEAPKIDAVLLTHAHIDHSGLLPKLMRAGFKGPIYATPSTVELCGALLADAGGIQEMEVEQLNRRNRQRGGAPIEPIYTRSDAAACQALFRHVGFDEWAQILPGLRARWWNAGHILGSASIEVEAKDAGGASEHILFSGDVGPGGSEFIPDPEGPAGLDHLVLESTYGGADRPVLSIADRQAMLTDELLKAHAAGGPLLIPAFAVERTQELIIDLLQAMESGAAPRGPIFVDSPLAVSVMDSYLRYGKDQRGDNPFAHLRESGWLKFTEAASESKAIERVKGWHVILSASGMCDAGRVRHHLQRLLWQPQATVMLVGYQAVGTLGRLLRDGVKDVRIQGEHIKVAAQIRALDIYSGHADAKTLVKWAQARSPIAGSIFLTHGEPQSRDDVQARLRAAKAAGGDVFAPQLDQAYRLDGVKVVAEAAPSPRLAPETPAKLDWHNARVDFLNTLTQRLMAAPDDAARERMLAGLKAQLGAAPKT
ncbi:MAG: MBL fold metallo-hydrolase [Proteobacteria bacterium]|nr:MBL fold metallo-hydrolase [Pseudomonadota bacterium]